MANRIIFISESPTLLRTRGRLEDPKSPAPNVDGKCFLIQGAMSYSCKSLSTASGY